MNLAVRLRNESGTALLLAIVLGTVLGGVASVIALTARMETLVAGRVEQGQSLRYGAEGALGLALADLGAMDWTAALAGMPSTFTAGNPGAAQGMPGVGPIQLCCGAGSLTAQVQQSANAGKAWGADTPQWRVYAWGPAQSWLHPGAIHAPFYVAAWIADDPADGDGDPATDANGTIGVYAVALGPAGGRRSVRVAVARPRDAQGNPRIRGVRIVTWHETQW